MVDSSLIKVVSSASAIEEVVGLENVVPVDVVEALEVVELEYAPVVVGVVVFQGKVDSAGASS